MKKIFKLIKHPSLILIYLNKFNLVKLSDKKYIELTYLNAMGIKPNLINPITFNEKIQWLKLHDHNKKYNAMVDKYEAKKIVSSKLGKQYVIPTIGIYDNFNEIDISSLPQKFVIKCTHDSGGIIICNDKKTFDFKRAEKIIKKSLHKNFFYSAREWVYKDIKPRILIEKNMGNDLTDYRFYCFDGKVQYIYQYINQSQSDCTKPEPLYCNIYDRNWILQNFKQAYSPSKKKYPKPKQLAEMVILSEKLSKSIPFLRVDFYVISGNIYFGEMTFYPGAGLSQFYPGDADVMLGNMLKIKR